MEISDYACGSCALAWVKDLGMHKNALDALQAFCSQTLGSGKYGCSTPGPNYVWVAGPEVPGKGHSKKWVKYGTEFAAFIQENDLGTVATCGPVVNTKYHPDTTCQVWTWTPDKDKLTAWWKANRPAPKVPKPRVPKPEPQPSDQVWKPAIGLTVPTAYTALKDFLEEANG